MGEGSNFRRFTIARESLERLSAGNAERDGSKRINAERPAIDGEKPLS